MQASWRLARSAHIFRWGEFANPFMDGDGAPIHAPMEYDGAHRMCDTKKPQTSDAPLVHAKAQAFTRTRRGKHNVVNAVWRRGVPGENKISCYGQWRPGTRREAVRVNRDGETRWHRPHRAHGAAILFSSGIASDS